jgi:hypothetical protein
MNVQVLADPFAQLLWASPALPGAVHDVRAASAARSTHRAGGGGRPSLPARRPDQQPLASGSCAHLVKVTRKEGNMHPSPDRSEILETDREGPQVWSGRPTVSDRSTPTSG